MENMYPTILLVHTVFGLALIIYLLFPVVIAWLRGATTNTQVSTLNVLQNINRVGQFLLIIQFFSGGMMMTHAKYSTMWMAVITILLVAIGAFTGIMAKPMKNWKLAIETGQDAVTYNKVMILSVLNALAYAVILFMMYHPMYR